MIMTTDTNIYFCPTCPESSQLHEQDEMYDADTCNECATCLDNGKPFVPEGNSGDQWRKGER